MHLEFYFIGEKLAINLPSNTHYITIAQQKGTTYLKINYISCLELNIVFIKSLTTNVCIIHIIPEVGSRVQNVKHLDKTYIN